MSMLAHTTVCDDNPYRYTEEDLESALQQQREELESQVEEELKHKRVISENTLQPPPRSLKQSSDPVPSHTTLLTNSYITF
jgi:hypothetical protein